MSTIFAARSLSAIACEEIDRCAIWALRTEVELFPKAGLVSFVDNGSHDDMDAGTFLRSAAALKGYFAEMAAAGAGGADFPVLKTIGLTAENRMFAATDGINTHRGAVFSLGLLAAAAGIAHVQRELSALRICRGVERWGRAILASRPAHDASHGAHVRTRYGAPGAREEAAAGFPTIAFHTLPAFHKAYEACGCVSTAGLQAFYAGMTVLDDNNLLYRGGPEGLDEARSMAHEFVRHGGMLAPLGFERALAMHRHFTARRLSPGGSADLLVATLFLVAVEGRIDAAWE